MIDDRTQAICCKNHLLVINLYSVLFIGVVHGYALALHLWSTPKANSEKAVSRLDRSVMIMPINTLDFKCNVTNIDLSSQICATQLCNPEILTHL